ncbi:response regulator transcription factor [Culicoidibacter larvae]|uniref:Response regulator transcription factor n=1 Tax=Culicoidibacter larvae TaxID=2579976 RepID=A0A5R8QBH5_9FIRM|nr:response regulator transcription factor [Culicoidibacter larvae]TLG73898.1 response regulator transcription factor [Culicoidibacter larvae]
MKHILFVDDNQSYAIQMQEILSEAGYDVDIAFDSISAIEQFSKNSESYDLIISDRVMGNDDGIRFLSIIKNMDATLKTILLTAEPTPDSELEALNQYVDYYLTKDINRDVLLKYIERVLEQPLAIQNDERMLTSEIEQIQVFLKERKVLVGGVEIELRRKEFDLLALFLANKGVAFSREEILERLWDRNHESTDERVIDVHINTLRRKLQISSLISVRGFGYKWDE